MPPVVVNKARLAGADEWLRDLPALVESLCTSWAITVGETYDDATEALVAAVTMYDGTPAVVKLLVPRAADAAANEITALRLAHGDGCARLLRSDESLGALLLERLGTPMSKLGWPVAARHEALCDVASRMWRPAPGATLPSGADKGRWLIDAIVTTWEALDRPCSERAPLRRRWTAPTRASPRMTTSAPYW